MIEHKRTYCVPTRLAETLTELASRGWDNAPSQVAAYDSAGNVDRYVIDSTRDSLLYVEAPTGTVHRDDLFFRLARLGPASRAALLGYLVTCETNAGIVEAVVGTDAPTGPSRAAPPPPPVPTDATLAGAAAAATGGTEVPSDADDAKPAAPADPAKFVECPMCDGAGSVELDLGDEGTAKIACPVCGGRGEVSGRVAAAATSNPESYTKPAIVRHFEEKRKADEREAKRLAEAADAEPTGPSLGEGPPADADPPAAEGPEREPTPPAES